LDSKLRCLSLVGSYFGVHFGRFQLGAQKARVDVLDDFGEERDDDVFVREVFALFEVRRKKRLDSCAFGPVPARDGGGAVREVCVAGALSVDVEADADLGGDASYMLQHARNARFAAELPLEHCPRWRGLAGRKLGHELIGVPAKGGAHLGGHLGECSFETALADEAPRTGDVGPNVEVGHDLVVSSLWRKGPRESFTAGRGWWRRRGSSCDATMVMGVHALFMITKLLQGRTPPPPPYEYTAQEELAHALTHGVGALLALVAFGVLLVPALVHKSSAHVTGCAVYGVTLVMLYLASTLYHAVPASNARLKRWTQRLDHAAIYLFIAGSYTPFALFVLGDPWGPPLLGAIWGLAAVGLMVVVSPLRRFERLSLALYLFMGWLAVGVARPLFDAVSWPVVLLLTTSGLSYTLGVAFFVQERKWAHTVWHGFVLAGTTLHFLAVVAVV
jgi:hemolysin III